ETANMKLRPHHLLDIVTQYGAGDEFVPHPYGHAVHTVAETVLSDTSTKVEFVVGADEICKPCKHLQPNGKCDDFLYQVDPPRSKQEYNDELDNKLFTYLEFSPGTMMTVRKYLEMVNRKVPGVEKVCTHPGEETAARLEGLTRGLIKLEIRSDTG
ncbi:DUF1284 domain-containing protein, partial [candidate division KSB1 bacterium]